MEIKKGKTLKGKIIAAATAISLFTGVTVSSTFDSASDIMMSDIKEPTPIVEVVDLKKAEAPPVVEKIAEEEEKRLTLKQRLAQKIMALPAGVRAAVVVPLYALGALVSRTAGAAFFQHVFCHFRVEARAYDERSAGVNRTVRLFCRQHSARTDNH